MSPHATLSIISPGDMGSAIAKLLSAHDYRVITNVSDRSSSTHDRALAAGIEILSSDKELLAQSDYILSIVPPRDAVSTAERFVDAFREMEMEMETVRKEEEGRELWYVDLNAISPATAKDIAGKFEGTRVRFVDGGIIGGPPKLQDNNGGGKWTKPSLVLSGPHHLDERLGETLNMTYVGDAIGKASGLKCCFAATSKGLIAIAIQSFTTAKRMGVLEELREHLGGFSPGIKGVVERGVGGMPPKAYRWIDEMKEIARTMREEGGWEGGGRDGGGGGAGRAGGGDLFECVSEIYGVVDEVLGENPTPATVEDVVGLVEEGVGRRQGRGLGEL